MKASALSSRSAWLSAIGGIILLTTAVILICSKPNRHIREPLIGEMNHHFGTLPIEQTASGLHHVFTLRNISEQAIHIRKISTTCGCTDAKTDTDDIAPGATLMVSAVLHLSAPGPKLANILLVTDQPEQEIVRLSLAAVAHQARQLLAVPSHLVVRPGQSTTLTVFAIDSTGQTLGTPSISTLRGLTAVFNGWSIVHAAEVQSSRPARWQGRFVLDATDSFLLGTRLDFHITLDGFLPITGPVQMQPPDPSMPHQR